MNAKAMLYEASTETLLYWYRKNFPLGVTTWGPCPVCGNAARGSGFCKDCLSQEILDRSKDHAAVSAWITELTSSLLAGQQAAQRAEDLCEAIERCTG